MTLASLAPATDQVTPFEAARKFVAGRTSVNAGELAKEIGVAVSVARGFLDSFQKEGIVGPANEIGRRLVLASLSLTNGPHTVQSVMINDDVYDANLALLGERSGEGEARFHSINEMPVEGAAQPSSSEAVGRTSNARLRTIIERIERLEEDKAVVAEDLKEVFAEAKGEGFDVKILRKVVRIRKQDKTKRSEEESLIDLYLSAIEG